MATAHARAAILSVGDELALGQSLDTNSRWLSAALVERGILPVEHVTVPDDLDALTDAFRRLAARAELVISTGGLGPTEDDLTRRALARAMGEPLVEDAGALEAIRAIFAARGREMPEANRVQAQRPAGAESLPNPHGTAPGIAARLRAPNAAAADVFCLPGPPDEMVPMFQACVAPRLRPVPGRTVVTRILHTVGIGESDLAARLGPLMQRTRAPLVGTTAGKGVVSVRIRYDGPLARDQAARVVNETAAAVAEAAGPYLFGEGEATLPAVVLARLRERGERLAVAESCTSGLLGAMLTDVPGSSAVFLGGWITYSNEMKQRELSVPANLFGPGAPGAVSREVAVAMAENARRRAGADHALAITGIAGPEGGTEAKPVGTVWIARTASGQPAEARRFQFRAGREVVRHRAAMSALAMLRFHLIGAAGTPMLWQVG